MFPLRPFRTGARRRAFTLVELLVAVAIAALLVAIAIPALKLNLRGQSIREAARQINSFIDEARSQAAGSGRPFGVLIERDGNGSFGNPRRAYRLYHCEVPTPYTGNLLPAPESPDPRLRLGSRAYITPNTGLNGAEEAVLTYASLRMIMPGDEIAFDGSATRYQILNATDIFPPITTPHATRVRIVFGAATAPPPTTGPEAPPTDAEPWNPATMGTITMGHSFRVYRQPVKIASSVLELPRSAAIDLDWSGVGAMGVQFSEFNQVSGNTQEFALNPIVILFEPSGAVRSVQAPLRVPATTTPPITPEHLILDPQRVFEPIYFLVGRLDQVEDGFTVQAPVPNWTDPNAEILSNVMDPDSLWVKIEPSSGMTLTVENVGPGSATARGFGALNARELARMSAGAGG
jgi:prepilin-type N-terminal cleavage/methylation domain-containing protein